MVLIFLAKKNVLVIDANNAKNLKTEDVIINTLEGESLNSEVMNVIDRKILHLPLKKKDGNKVEQKSRGKTKMNVLTDDARIEIESANSISIESDLLVCFF